VDFPRVLVASLVLAIENRPKNEDEDENEDEDDKEHWPALNLSP